MSIATNSLLRPILAEVRGNPLPDALGPPWRRSWGGQLLELRRSSGRDLSSCSTPLHFWAYALRDFLDAHARPDLFDALAVQCLCEAVDGARVPAALRQVADRMTPPGPVEIGSGYRIGYRMIDQEVIASWVAERESLAVGEFVALFWARTDWLETARPLETFRLT